MSHHAAIPKEDISIAFTQSQYPTPYTDHTIPGSTPGHRLRSLGRQHQPPDILYNHLSHALIAHGDSALPNTATPWEGNADHPTPPGGNYVLHTKNGGKRHFDEVSGQYSEQPWQPSKRIILPLQEEERKRVPQRRGRGVYNLDDNYIHPDAEAALRQREVAEERRREHGGKARVGGPPDHSLADLGMVQQQQQPLVLSSSAHAPAGATGTATIDHAAVMAGGANTHNTQDVSLALEQGKRKTDVVDGRRESAAGNALLPSSGANVPPPRGTAAEADAIAEYHRNQRMRGTLRERKEATSATATRAADVQSVRELPNW